jgi:hypothetical protein
MVKKLRCRATSDSLARVRVAGRTAVVVLCFLGGVSRMLGGQEDVHYLHQGVMPPGAIGNMQLQRGGPLAGYFQPVEIKAPEGAAISLAVGNQFVDATAAPVRVGLLVGQVYRIRVTQIPLAEGVEVFPTIEVIDRLYVPNGQERRFPIPIELSEEDLRLAASGKFVTRVIYLEDPFRAVPVAQQDGSAGWFDVGPGRDPLAAADEMGRPVAILRLGARLPGVGGETDEAFCYGSPPACRYACPPRVKQLPAPPKAKATKKKQQAEQERS